MFSQSVALSLTACACLTNELPVSHPEVDATQAALSGIGFDNTCTCARCFVAGAATSSSCCACSTELSLTCMLRLRGIFAGCGSSCHAGSTAISKFFLHIHVARTQRREAPLLVHSDCTMSRNHLVISASNCGGHTRGFQGTPEERSSSRRGLNDE